jgi:hypothetical protein
MNAVCIEQPHQQQRSYKVGSFPYLQQQHQVQQQQLFNSCFTSSARYIYVMVDRPSHEPCGFNQ